MYIYWYTVCTCTSELCNFFLQATSEWVSRSFYQSSSLARARRSKEQWRISSRVWESLTRTETDSSTRQNYGMSWPVLVSLTCSHTLTKLCCVASQWEDSKPNMFWESGWEGSYYSTITSLICVTECMTPAAVHVPKVYLSLLARWEADRWWGGHTIVWCGGQPGTSQLWRYAPSKTLPNEGRGALIRTRTLPSHLFHKPINFWLDTTKLELGCSWVLTQMLEIKSSPSWLLLWLNSSLSIEQGSEQFWGQVEISSSYKSEPKLLFQISTPDKSRLENLSLNLVIPLPY